MPDPVNYLELSDEELKNTPPPEPVAATEAAVVEEAPATETTEASVTTAPAGDGQGVVAGDERSEEAEAETAAAGAAATTENTEAKIETEAAVKPADGEPEKESPPTTAPTEQAAAIDYKAEYERLTAPFKANGRELAVKSVDDAIALMQMGANYNKKMAALKPNLKLMKLLENSGLLSEEKISFLIDLDKKNPAAINKLVSDSKIDPMDLSADKASEYKQSTYTVDDREIELDTVLDEIKDSAAYTRTLEVVSTKWDGASKQTIASNPQLLKVINDHVDRGIYDVISKEVESERLFGRLNGLSDIEAYRHVGDAINARGGFNHLVQGRPLNPGQPTAAAAITPPTPQPAEDDKLNDKRRAASSTKPAAPSTTAPAFDPLGMSDEEFSKHVNSKFL